MNQHLAKAIEIMNKNKIYDIGKMLALVAFGLAAKAITEDGLYSYCMLPLVLAGAGIAASVFGGKKSKAPPTPKPVDIFARGEKGGPSIAENQATGLFSEYYPTAVPLALKTSAKYGPEIMGQMFGQTGQFLRGVSGRPGFQELQRTTGLRAGQTIADLRAAELAQQTRQTGLTRGLMESLSPEQAAVVQASAQEAERARLSAQGVTPQEQRMYQQTAREAAQASGRLGGNAAIASEIMGRENIMAAKRAEAAQAGQRSYAMAGEFYTNSGLAALRSPSLSYGAGQQDLRTALTLGPSSSGEFDYNMPLGFAQNQGAAQNQYNQDLYATKLANQQAKSQMWQGIGSSLLSAGLGSMGGASGSNFSNFLGGGNFGNAGTAFGNMGREAMGMPLRAYTV